MLTGVVAEKHGLLDGLPYIGWPGLNVPTLFNVVHDAGLSTGMVFGKEKLNYLVLGDSVDSLFGIDTHDEVIKEEAVEFIRQGLPNVLFVHFPDIDRVGHEMGWMSEHQLNAVTYVDGLIGEIVAELENEGYWNNTLMIVTADHGGHGHDHGDDSPVDRTIPWLAVGPGVPSGITMGHIYIYDTAATVLHAFDLPIPDYWDGRPVMEIFQ
jgi:phosphopentomutase